MTEEVEDLVADAQAAMDYSDDTGRFWVGRLADALEARQLSEDDREVLAKQLRDIGAVRKVDQDCSCQDCEGAAEWVNAPLSVVLDHFKTNVSDAETEIERYKDAAEGNRIRLVHAQSDAERFEAERDDALAAIERVRAIHVRHKDTHKPDPSVINGNWFCCGAVQLGAVDPYACIACDSPEWPCPTIQALDGAPEPEWEYGREYVDEAGDPHIHTTQDVTSPDGHRADGSPYWNYRAVRRRKAGPWLPVEGESRE